MSKHPLVNRTSPKGQPFVGTCPACGKTGITSEMLWTDDCPKAHTYTRERAVMEALASPIARILP